MTIDKIKAYIRRAIKARTRTFALEHVTPRGVMWDLDRLALVNCDAQDTLKQEILDAA